MAEEWYWCLPHDRAETGQDCPAAVRLGPYASQEEARAHADRTERRNDEWEAQDRRWEGRA